MRALHTLHYIHNVSVYLWMADFRKDLYNHGTFGKSNLHFACEICMAQLKLVLKIHNSDLTISPELLQSTNMI